MGLDTGGIPKTDNIPETTEKLGCPTDKFYFKIMFLSHNNAVFIINSKSKIFINSLKSAYDLAYKSYILIETLL